jgi:hypothetical protein
VGREAQDEGEREADRDHGDERRVVRRQGRFSVSAMG